LNADERSLLWAVALEDSARKGILAQRLSWGNSKLNACLSTLKKKNALSVATQTKDGTGRKPLSFSLAPDLGYFIGIQSDIAGDFFVLIDAAGKKVAEKTYPVLAWEDSAESAFLSNIDDFLPPDSDIRKRTLAIGMSCSIRFNKSGSASRRSPSFTNDAVLPLMLAIERRAGIPVFAGRPQVLLCHQGDIRNLVARKESFINIIVTDHLGLAVFVHGESWLGQSGLSGDLGHLKVAGNELLCYCGASGCLRTKLSYMGLCQETRRRLSEIADEGGSRRLDERDFEGPDYAPAVARLIDAANNHDALATGVIYDAATDLGTALASVVSLFNPARLIVHSILTETREIFSERVRTMIRKNCLDLYSRDLTLDFRGYSLESNALGAAMFGRDSFLKKALGIR